MQLYIYGFSLYPLDWEFCFLTVAEYKTMINKKIDEDYGTNNPKFAEAINRIDEIYTLALEGYNDMCSGLEISNELRCEPMVVPLPSVVFNNEAQFAIILKMNNDGDTFIYSPIELPYLENTE